MKNYIFINFGPYLYCTSKNRLNSISNFGQHFFVKVKQDVKYKDQMVFCWTALPLYINLLCQANCSIVVNPISIFPNDCTRRWSSGADCRDGTTEKEGALPVVNHCTTVMRSPRNVLRHHSARSPESMP